MAGKIIADTLEHSTAGSLSTEYVVNGSAKAWVNINQTGTQAVRDSINVSSISDIAAGRTQVTVSNAFANNTYLATLALRMQSTVSNTGSSGGVDTSDGSTAITTTQYQLSYINTGTTGDGDTPYGGNAIHGDLA